MPSKLSFAAAAFFGLVVNGGVWIYCRQDIGGVNAENRMNIPSGALFFLATFTSTALSNRLLAPALRRKNQ